MPFSEHGIHESFGCVVTDDERYVVLLGGSLRSADASDESAKQIDSIVVYDVGDMKFQISEFKCPQTERIGAVLSENEGIIHLFAKRKHWCLDIADVFSASLTCLAFLRVTLRDLAFLLFALILQ